ncbi:MAG: CAP domain-containing protein [Candidatus Staskawiczbacteria bacterium]|nr:CAP domain-containing protein [Candidatus Staskawiczbacteria bacterium]
MDYNLGKLNLSPELLEKTMQNNVLLYFVVLLLVLKIGTTLIAINIPQNIFFADITRSSLESFANQTRQSLGLPALKENQKLNEAAQLKAQNMVQNNYFAHTSPTGVSPWAWFLKAGYNYKYAGENLAIGFFDSQEVYQAWLNSPSHKANIVNPNYTEVGTAVLDGFGSGNTIVVVQEFGSQLPVKTAVAKNTGIKPVVKTQPKTNSAPKVADTPASTTNTSEKVLSQSTESKNSIEPLTTNGINDAHSRLLNYVLYNYDGLLQDIIYGVSMVVIGLLLTLIFFNFDFSPRRQLIFRSVLIVILLSLATAFNKELLISFIPHQVII